MRKISGIFIVLAFAALGATVSWAQSERGVSGAPPDTTASGEAMPQVELKIDTAFAYCALEMKGSYEQHEAAFGGLYGEAAKQGIAGGMPFGIYWNSPVDTPVEKLSWDVGFMMPPGKTPQDPLKLKKWDYTTMASLKYRGLFGGEEMNAAYGAVYTWIGENGYQPAGPMMEMFLNMPSPDENGVLYGAIEIIVPIAKAAPAKETEAK